MIIKKKFMTDSYNKRLVELIYQLREDMKKEFATGTGDKAKFLNLLSQVDFLSGFISNLEDELEDKKNVKSSKS